MTVITRFYSQPRYKFKIDRSCYFPVPNVHGALTTFALHLPSQRPVVRSPKEYLSLVRQSFQAKRKLISNALSPAWDKDAVSSALAKMGLSDQVCSGLWPAHDCCWANGPVGKHAAQKVPVMLQYVMFHMGHPAHLPNLKVMVCRHGLKS